MQPVQQVGTPPYKNSDITNRSNGSAEKNRGCLSGSKEEENEKRRGNRKNVSMRTPIDFASPTPLERVGDIDSTLRAQLLVSFLIRHVILFMFCDITYFM